MIDPSDAGAEPANELRRNVLGLPSALGMSLAFISPTIGVLFISALVAGKAGLSSPFVFILGTVGISLMASTLAQFTKRVTAAGTFYKFITLSIGPSVGFVAGMLLMFAYALQSPLNSNLFGGFVSQVLKQDLGIGVPWWVLMILVVVFVGALAWYSVHTSMKFDIAFLIAEVVVVGVLLLLIIIRGGAEGQAPQAFTPTHSPTGVGGLGEAFVFIVMTFFGFESCSTVAEEVRNPRRNLPIALIGSVAATGLWFVFAVYAIIVGYGPSHVDQIASATAPLHALAERYMGNWYATVVDLAAVSAIVAVLLAIHTANFRILYSLGRDGLLPRALGRTHHKHGTPHVAIIVYSVFTLLIGISAGAAWGPMAAFGNLGYLSSMGILPIFVLTNVALPVFIWRRYRSEFSWIKHLLFPALSSVTFLAAMWLNLHPWPAAPLNVFPWVVLGWVLASIGWLTVLRRRGADSIKRLGTVLFVEAEGVAEHARPDEVADAVAAERG
ncbi:APC family permease [Actinacidiphila soli]|uniref:APC family permease n=1 Tax=Actinacidiphila soli TaxID=2487275 RepID=UPI0013E34926|nr:APC family permease [Actinacidiphila soli]